MHGIEDGEIILVASRRGAIHATAHLDPTLRPGLAFMSFHYQDSTATNVLTIDATDPKSGTAEFKAAAIRIEKLAAGEVPELVGAAVGVREH